jgi:hypothetical protein
MRSFTPTLRPSLNDHLLTVSCGLIAGVNPTLVVIYLLIERAVVPVVLLLLALQVAKPNQRIELFRAYLRFNDQGHLGCTGAQ